MSYPEIAIVILHWNNAPDTARCLESVERLDYPHYRVLIVDNGSTDGSAARLAAAHPHIEMIGTGRNLGYAAGNNVGLAHALQQGAAYVLLLNNDAALDPAALVELVAAAESHPGAAFLGPKILHRDRPDRIQSAGATLDWLWRSHQRGLDQADSGQFDAPAEVDYVIGAAVLVRGAALARIGLLDPDFFLYREDVDWCLRARKHGYRALYVPAARAWHRSHHVREQDLPRITYYMTRNWLLLIKKNRGGVLRLTAVLLRRLLTAAVWTLRPKWRHKRVERDALLRGLADFFRGKVGQGYA